MLIVLRCLLCLSLLLPALAQAGPLTLHPHGEVMPTNQQGPFVTTADGGILCIDATQAHHSLDEGQTWTSTPLFQSPDQFKVSGERALLRTRQGTIISAWMNMKEYSTAPGYKWGGSPAEYDQWILPTYISRSLDDGKTWEEPLLLHKPWCGCIHSLIQTRSGRIVLVGQTIIPAWRHATMTFVSDDEGRTWTMSNILDYGVGRHDHAGSCEATILERNDNSLYMLLRTESGYFYEAVSHDEGLTWIDMKKSSVPSVTCCGQLARLADGRAVLLWNHPLRSNPQDGHSRYELSIAFSHDDGQTWQDRTVIATRYPQVGDRPHVNRTSYPYLYERHPGQLWITTMQGDIRLNIKTADITKDEAPLPPSILFLGDSTTALRPGEVKQVFAQRLQEKLAASYPGLQFINSGVPGSTTAAGLARFRDQFPRTNAKIVVVQFGINDAAVDVWKNPPASQSRVPLAQYVQNLKEIVKIAREGGAEVLLMTTNPVRWTEKYKQLYGKSPYDIQDPQGFERPLLTSYNQAVRTLASELDVTLVDLNEIYLQHSEEQGQPVDSLLLDGVHPNDNGHALITTTLEPLLKKSLP